MGWTSGGDRVRGVNRQKIALLFLAASTLVISGGAPDAAAFGLSGIALYYGKSLRAWRMDVPMGCWFVASVAFWYSTVIWFWWHRHVPGFPLFLLNAELRITLLYGWVPFFVLLGTLAQGSRQKRK